MKLKKEKEAIVSAIKNINKAEEDLKFYYKNWDNFIKNEGDGEPWAGFLSQLGEAERSLINEWERFEDLPMPVDKIDVNLLRRAEKGQKK